MKTLQEHKFRYQSKTQRVQLVTVLQVSGKIDRSIFFCIQYMPDPKSMQLTFGDISYRSVSNRVSSPQEKI